LSLERTAKETKSSSRSWPRLQQLAPAPNGSGTWKRQLFKSKELALGVLAWYLHVVSSPGGCSGKWVWPPHYP
jgi:hypothetical protein